MGQFLFPTLGQHFPVELVHVVIVCSMEVTHLCVLEFRQGLVADFSLLPSTWFFCICNSIVCLLSANETASHLYFPYTQRDFQVCQAMAEKAGLHITWKLSQRDVKIILLDQQTGMFFCAGPTIWQRLQLVKLDIITQRWRSLIMQ